MFYSVDLVIYINTSCFQLGRSGGTGLSIQLPPHSVFDLLFLTVYVFYIKKQPKNTFLNDSFFLRVRVCKSQTAQTLQSNS